MSNEVSRLASLGLAVNERDEPSSSSATFDDGGHYRIEIPSVEGSEAFAAVVDEANRRKIRVHRVSQGSGIMLLTNDEIRDMVALGAERSIEVCLFTGPRAAWDIGAQSRASAGSSVAAAARGGSQLVFALRDVERACTLGIRSVLLGDVGVIWAVARLRAAGEFPRDLIIKSSVALPAANPATAHVLEEIGVDSLNMPVDLTIGQISSIRSAVAVPLDCYIESPDDFGGCVRYHEIPAIVDVAAPVYLKFAVRNCAPLYPAGEHLRGVVLSSSRERVRRAAIGLELLAAAGKSFKGSP